MIRSIPRVLASLVLFLLFAGSAAGSPDAAAASESVDAATAGRFARLALDCVHQEYPNKIAHVMQSDSDALPPRTLTPAFYGCFDWHSSVHGHWLLVRLIRMFPNEDWAAEARAALDRSLTPEHIAGEVAYLTGKDRASYERPYGLAWMLQLCAELRAWDDPDGRRWLAAILPLENAVADKLASWLPKLTYPIRTGEHSQTAFALGLVYDWARGAGPDSPRAVALADLVAAKARSFHESDAACNLDYEPSGQVFLSPCLAEADLMRRVMDPDEFADWLTRFLPLLPEAESTAWLPVAIVSDRTDGKLAHLDGLNLSRAWMLEGIAEGLPKGDARLAALRAAAAEHRTAGLAAVTGEHYEGGHWLGSFAVYLVTGRGLRQ